MDTGKKMSNLKVLKETIILSYGDCGMLIMLLVLQMHFLGIIHRLYLIKIEID